MEFEDEGVEEEDYVEEEVVVQREEDDGEWEDEDSEGEGEDEDMEDENKGTKKKEIWDESKAPLQEGEELVFDNSAYQMLHRAKVEWPCLSIDILLPDRMRDRNNLNSWFPNYVHAFDPK